jgi:queuine tRNA-ribosyltransferase
MVFDECLPADAPLDVVRESLFQRTMPWAARCLDLHPRDGRAVFGIGQGGLFPELRKGHAESISAMPYDGFAIGGLSVGETWEAFSSMIKISTEIFPRARPRYLMGVGSLPEILEAVSLGIDMFDCVLPSRNARNGQALTFAGPVRIRNQSHLRDPAVLEKDCPCIPCASGLSRAYLRHLFLAKEMLGPMLMTSHNLTFMQRLMRRIRDSIQANTFQAERKELLRQWQLGSGTVKAMGTAPLHDDS